MDKLPIFWEIKPLPLKSMALNSILKAYTKLISDDVEDEKLENIGKLTLQYLANADVDTAIPDYFDSSLAEDSEYVLLIKILWAYLH